MFEREQDVRRESMGVGIGGRETRNKLIECLWLCKILHHLSIEPNNAAEHTKKTTFLERAMPLIGARSKNKKTRDYPSRPTSLKRSPSRHHAARPTSTLPGLNQRPS